MKKFSKRLLVSVLFVLLAFQAVTVSAATVDNKDASIGDAAGTAGETVSMTVKLSGKYTANTVGIEFTYDKDVLTLSNESAWLLSDEAIADVDPETGRAVWTTQDPIEITGDVFKVTFVIKEDAMEAVKEGTVLKDVTAAISMKDETKMKDGVVETISVQASGALSVTAPQTGDVNTAVWMFAAVAGIGILAFAIGKKRNML